MDAKVATVITMVYQFKELKEAASQLAQRKTDIKAVVAAHKTARAKRMVRVHNCVFNVFLSVEGFL